jgi:hypothetical protein
MVGAEKPRHFRSAYRLFYGMTNNKPCPQSAANAERSGGGPAMFSARRGRSCRWLQFQDVDFIPLSFKSFNQDSKASQASLIGHASAQALIVLDLLVDLVALPTHQPSPHP